MEELHTTEVSSKIADFKEIVTSFSELLTLENKALEEFDVETVSSLYERKAKTISAYRSLVAYFIKNQQELAALAEQERQEMKEISTRLDELINKRTVIEDQNGNQQKRHGYHCQYCQGQQ